MAKILIVEDEKAINDLVKFNLELVGHECSQVFDGESGLTEALKLKYDLIILDVMLPKYSGFEIMEYIEGTPVIFVTAKSTPADKIKGLRLGADDYITKPFNILEVKARIKAILRRNSKASAKTEASSRIETGDMRMDCDSRSLFIHDKEVYLTAKEFDLLELLVLNPNKVYSRETLLNTIWGYDYPGDARTVDVHVRRLREKIEENPSEPKYVHTKWGVGYYFNV